MSLTTDIDTMFMGATSFNQNISLWDVSHVQYFYKMFQGATAFNQNIGSFNLSSASDISNMLSGASLNSTNYDSLLLGWSSQKNLPAGLIFDAGYSQYSSTGLSARNDLTNSTNQWTITDGGLANASSIPLNVQISSGDSFVTLTWSAPTTNGSHAIVGYNIYRSTISGSGYSFIGTTNSVTFTFTDSSVTDGITYYYVVQASNYFISSPNSAEVSATPAGVPSAPQSLTAKAGNGFVYLTWSVPTSDGGSTLTNYSIYRSTTSGSGYVLLTTVSSSTLSYNDTSVTNGQTYYYVVKATNAVGSSPNSNEATGQPTAPKITTTTTPLTVSSPILTSSTSSSTKAKGTPGFEALTLLLLMVSLAFYKRKRIS